MKLHSYNQNAFVGLVNAWNREEGDGGACSTFGREERPIQGFDG